MQEITHNCGEMRKDHVGRTVALAGWVNSYRDHGGVIFIDLRDREGITQIVFHPQQADAHELADQFRNEDVVWVRGKCIDRQPGMDNPKMATGTVELDADAAEILNKVETPPFLPDDAHQVGEEIRLTYRYLDLRRPRMQKILRTRHRVSKIVRDYFDEQGFYEVETPFLCPSTPEGARDFLVPSRIQDGSFYALPQSPQLFKQVLMAAGLEKYIQIVKCFRDEDPRADRQAEFTQIDMEMSFVNELDVMNVAEGLVRRIWKQVLDVDVPPIRRMPYAEAMSRYGSDRPDLRFGMELIDVGEPAGRTTFKIFGNTLESGGMVKVIRVPGGAALSRKQTDDLAGWVKQFGAGGLPVTKLESGKFATGIAKFLEPVADELIRITGATDGDLLCFGVSKHPSVVYRTLGELRLRLGRELELNREGEWQWLWVVDFPLVEWNVPAKRWDSLHHPFTSPKEEDLDRLETEPGSVLSRAYDLGCNGAELGGGSIRIHRSDLQQRVFNLLGIDEASAKSKFGFLLNALRYGAPPHGGLAMGLDRIVMMLENTSNIRDVIAFPKTQNGADLMTAAPSLVDDAQLQELSLRTLAP